MGPAAKDNALLVIEQYHEQAEEGHKRLRTVTDKLESELDALSAVQATLAARILSIETTLASIEKRKTDLSDVRVTPQILVTVVIAVATIVGGQYASTSGLRSDSRDNSTRLEAQIKLQDERAAFFRQSIDQMTRFQQLQSRDTQELKDMITRQGAKK